MIHTTTTILVAFSPTEHAARSGIGCGGTFFCAALLIVMIFTLRKTPRNSAAWLLTFLLAIGLVLFITLAANAQRIPGRRTPPPTPPQPVAMDILRFTSDQWPNGGGPMWLEGTTFAFSASDGRAYSCAMKSGVCDFEVPAGVLVSREKMFEKLTVTTPDGLKIVWTNGTRIDGMKAVTVTEKVNVGTFKPPEPPIVRRRVRPSLPPMVVPVGVEWSAMPPPVMLNFMAASFPGVYIVITDGKVWFIRERQGLPVVAPFRVVWP